MKPYPADASAELPAKLMKDRGQSHRFNSCEQPIVYPHEELSLLQPTVTGCCAYPENLSLKEYEFDTRLGVWRTGGPTSGRHGLLRRAIRGILALDAHRLPDKGG